MLYPLMNIIGPLLLLAVIIFVTLRMRKRKPEEKIAAEKGARRLRKQLNEEDTTRENGSR